MYVRPITSSDYPRLRELFAEQGFDYELPDYGELVAGHVVEDGGQIVQAVLARPTVELYFLGDERWQTPAWRMEALRKVHESMRCDLQGKGFSDVHAFLPPEKAKSFSRRLVRNFGWTEPLWKSLTRPTAPRQ